MEGDATKWKKDYFKKKLRQLNVDFSVSATRAELADLYETELGRKFIELVRIEDDRSSGNSSEHSPVSEVARELHKTSENDPERSILPPLPAVTAAVSPSAASDRTKTAVVCRAIPANFAPAALAANTAETESMRSRKCNVSEPILPITYASVAAQSTSVRSNRVSSLPQLDLNEARSRTRAFEAISLILEHSVREDCSAEVAMLRKFIGERVAAERARIDEFFRDYICEVGPSTRPFLALPSRAEPLAAPDADVRRPERSRAKITTRPAEAESVELMTRSAETRRAGEMPPAVPRRASGEAASSEQQLRRRWTEMMDADSKEEVEPRLSRRRVEFKNVECSITKFSGDDQRRDVHDFLKRFDDMMDSYGADKQCRLRSLRRCLTGAALLTSEVHLEADYEQLKAALVAEHGRTRTYETIDHIMGETKWDRKSQTALAFLLSMQLIAKGSHLEETELIQKIVAGMQLDSSTAAVLLTERTLEGLKAAVRRHGRLLMTARPAGSRSVAGTRTAGPSRASTRGAAARPAAAAVAGFNGVTNDGVRCYNCNERGHMKSNCPFELRPYGTCFKCLQPGHKRSTCNNQPKKLPKKPKPATIAAVYGDDSVASVEEDDSLSSRLEALQTVSILIKRKRGFGVVLSVASFLFSIRAVRLTSSGRLYCEAEAAADPPLP